MLLATFMSALYGYNLSARPDYDRDIPRKKAASLIYRFVFQHSFAADLLRRVKNNDSGHENPPFILPGDVLYADTGGGANADYTLVYDQTHPSASDGNGTKFPLRKEAGANRNYMQEGRKLISGDEMVSKVVCLDRLMTCTNADSGHLLCRAADGSVGYAKMCEIDVDPSMPGVITDTCCVPSKALGGTYLVSFMKLDARWKGRVSGTLSYDFWRAIEVRGFNENIGVITWNNNAWQFKGRMHFYPSFQMEAHNWLETHPNTETDPFPLHRKFRTDWTLPVHVFTRDFFKVNGKNYCDDGCLFRIKSFI